MQIHTAASEVIRRCRLLAQYSEEPGVTTRTFLSEPMRQVHTQLRHWMEQAGMDVRIDGAGNLLGDYRTSNPAAKQRFVLGSHLDTVPRAGAFDGVLGVMIAIALVELLDHRALPYLLTIAGFSEEEGVRFGVPFIGSRAFIGTLDDELLARRDANRISVRDAIAAFGLNPHQGAPVDDADGFLEFHIEQGPVLESLGLPLGVVTDIAGQSRFTVTFEGSANHAGTTPMHLRRDALTGAAEWITAVEQRALSNPGLVATVGRIDVEPAATNIIPSRACLSLDVRHAEDAVRQHSLATLLENARAIANRRELTLVVTRNLDQAAVPMDPALTNELEQAVDAAGYPVHRMISGAGHDAMILAQRMPTAMLFLRSPAGISHHPDEAVLEEDVAAALAVGLSLLHNREILCTS